MLFFHMIYAFNDWIKTNITNWTYSVINIFWWGFAQHRMFVPFALFYQFLTNFTNIRAYCIAKVFIIFYRIILECINCNFMFSSYVIIECTSFESFSMAYGTLMIPIRQLVDEFRIKRAGFEMLSKSVWGEDVKFCTFIEKSPDGFDCKLCPCKTRSKISYIVPTASTTVGQWISK